MCLGLHAQKYMCLGLSLFFFSIQRAYGTLKQNLVNLKYTQVIN